MRPGRAACAPLLALCCFPAGTALSPSSRPPQDAGRIPKLIWVTGQWKADSEEVRGQVAKNIGGSPLERRLDVRAQVEAHFARWAPLGSYIRYLTDEDMDNSVRNISTMLAERGIKDVDKAYFNLRPGAFRADVWRLMQLWAEGGVYLDANVNLTCGLNEWIDFSNDELVVVMDTGVNYGIWNAMMAAEQRNPYIQNAIAAITGHIRTHYYGRNPLEITGPIAVGLSFKYHQGYPTGLRKDLQWKDGHVSFRERPNLYGGKLQGWKGRQVNNTHRNMVVATKDDNLHDKDASRHYDPMWHHRQVYCDQRGPQPDNGKCPEGSWRNEDGSVKYVDHAVSPVSHDHAVSHVRPSLPVFHPPKPSDRHEHRRRRTVESTTKNDGVHRRRRFEAYPPHRRRTGTR